MANYIGGLFGSNTSEVWGNEINHVLVSARGAGVGGVSGYQYSSIRDNVILDLTVAVSGSDAYAGDAVKTVTLADRTKKTFKNNCFVWAAPQMKKQVKLTDLTAGQADVIEIVYISVPARVTVWAVCPVSASAIIIRTGWNISMYLRLVIWSVD